MKSSPKPKLILASASPRRAQILRDAGFSFTVLPTSVDESPQRGDFPERHVVRLARQKALAAAKLVHQDAVIVGADTVVLMRREMLGKPRSTSDARRMLHLLSGRKHRVLTGLAVQRTAAPGLARDAGGGVDSMCCEVESTSVWFASLTHREIEDYIATGEPEDKAGAYAIQGRAGRFITRIEGCYFNVVGLPLARLTRMLKEMGALTN